MSSQPIKLKENIAEIHRVYMKKKDIQVDVNKVSEALDAMIVPYEAARSLIMFSTIETRRSLLTGEVELQNATQLKGDGHRFGKFIKALIELFN